MRNGFVFGLVAGELHVVLGSAVLDADVLLEPRQPFAMRTAVLLFQQLFRFQRNSPAAIARSNVRRDACSTSACAALILPASVSGELCILRDLSDARIALPSN